MGRCGRSAPGRPCCRWRPEAASRRPAPASPGRPSSSPTSRGGASTRPARWRCCCRIGPPSSGCSARCWRRRRSRRARAGAGAGAAAGPGVARQAGAPVLSVPVRLHRRAGLLESSTMANVKLGTLAVHGGEDEVWTVPAVNTPIYQTTTYRFDSARRRGRLPRRARRQVALLAAGEPHRHRRGAEAGAAGGDGAGRPLRLRAWPPSTPRWSPTSRPATRCWWPTPSTARPPGWSGPSWPASA